MGDERSRSLPPRVSSKIDRFLLISFYLCDSHGRAVFQLNTLRKINDLDAGSHSPFS